MRKSLLKRLAVVAMSLALAFSMQAPVMALGDISVTAKAATENVGEYTISLTKKGAKKTLTLGIHKTLSLIVKEKNAVVTKNLKFASTKRDVATVSKKGLITTKKVGTTKINITDTKTKFKATLTIKVDYVDVSSLTLSAKSINLNVGQSTTLTATVAPAYSAVPKWTSFFPEVADVNNGVVTAKAAGTGIIVVNAGTKMEFCRVNVGGRTVPVSSVKMEPYGTLTGKFKAGDTAQFSVEVSPSNATNKAVDWDSTDPTVADVDDNGLVTFNGVGDCLITATAKDGSNAYGSCLVTVTDLILLEKTELCDPLTKATSGTYAEVVKDSLGNVTLYITGEGNIPDYNYDALGLKEEAERPWHSFKDSITDLEVGTGIERVGINAFKGMSGLEHVFLPNTTIEIKGTAFEDCSGLLVMSINKGGPKTTLSIDSYAFKNCTNLSIVRIPIRTYGRILGANSFDGCNVKAVLAEGSEAVTNSSSGIPTSQILYNAY
ncbi:MAG: Ig-like domain-containing protein [Lachnospiraceae bacterium]|nr:Ig-like domain-containing protein [Lachnospiraceae bacterium]